MVEDRREGDERLPGPLVDVVADPEQGRHRLPYLLGFLDGDDRRERLTASLALCLVVDEYPELLEYVVERLVDRLDDDAPVEVGHALDYLAARNPKAVDDAVTAMAQADEVRARTHLFQSGGGFARSEYLLPTTGDRPVGRTRLPGSVRDEDPRRVRTTDADDRDQDRDRDRDRDQNRDREQSVRRTDSAEDGRPESDGTGEAGDGSGDGGADDATVADDGTTDEGVTRSRLAAVSRRLSRVVAQCRFDDLRILSDRERGRYGDRYRAVATIDGEERALGLVVFRLPTPTEASSDDGGGDERPAETERDGSGSGNDEGGETEGGETKGGTTGGGETKGGTTGGGEREDDRTRTEGNGDRDGDEGGRTTAVNRARRTLVGRLQGALERWDAVDGHDRVLTVHDWGVRPRPWAALEYADATLADREVEGLDAAVGTALDVAAAVGHAHQHGVVHGALDPVNVVYPGTALTDSERSRPLVANPGLTVAYARVADAANFVDPRYAPPEYYDDRFGSIDHATDVHALGLLCYRLATGEHPYEWTDHVREAVLAGDLPSPSTVNPDLPAAFDRVVEKATAVRKLKRYETVTVFRHELRGVDGGE